MIAASEQPATDFWALLSLLHNVEAEGPEPAGRAELKIYRQRSAASWRRSTRATGWASSRLGTYKASLDAHCCDKCCRGSDEIDEQEYRGQCIEALFAQQCASGKGEQAEAPKKASNTPATTPKVPGRVGDEADATSDEQRAITRALFT